MTMHSIQKEARSMLNRDKFRKYAVEISKNVYLQEDESKNCRNYPNSELSSYVDCDELYMKNICKRINFSLIWLHFESPLCILQMFWSVCTVQFLGYETSPCPRPCKTFQTKFVSHLNIPKKFY